MIPIGKGSGASPVESYREHSVESTVCSHSGFAQILMDNAE